MHFSGKVVAQQWLKLRYGVFEEHGYAGDKLYPLNYINSEDADIYPTSCTDFVAASGSWITQ